MDVLLLCLIPLLYSFLCLCILILQRRGQTCYMLAYECYKPREDTKLSTDSCARIVLRNRNLGLEEYRFLLKVMVSSGIGENTYCPKNILEGREQSPTLKDALAETDEVMFSTLDNLFKRTGFSPSDIDILIVNVSLFATPPSLPARVINRYKMRENIKAFHLAGMGCSGSLVAIDLVQQLFKTYKNQLAIVVSTESLSNSWYCGKNKTMMLSNIIFRSGGCSLLFTNSSALKRRAILKLKLLERTHLGADDEAYGCCMQVEDDEGYRGMRLTKNVVKTAEQALTANLRQVVPKILPLWELVRFFVVCLRKTMGKKALSFNVLEGGLNLKSGIQHFCLHPGGRAIIDAVGQGLGLGEYDLEPSRMALHRWGNTSVGGIWYALGYMEAKKRLTKGDRILMTSLGAGIKCNNCVWEVMRDLKDPNVWKDCIDCYPPKSMNNLCDEKYSWVHEEYLNFVRFDPSKISVE